MAGECMAGGGGRERSCCQLYIYSKYTRALTFENVSRDVWQVETDESVLVVNFGAQGAVGSQVLCSL